MIRKEAWHAEVASFEKEREQLYHDYSQGKITAEEFAKRMLRLWDISKGPPLGLLEPGPHDPLLISIDWLSVHRDWVRRWREQRQELQRIREEYTGRAVSPRNHITRLIDTLGVDPNRFWEWMSVITSSGLFGVGEPALVPDGLPGRWRASSEEEFNHFVESTLGFGDMVLQIMREDLARLEEEASRGE